MTDVDRWLVHCGFEVWHIPGVSRCWRLQYAAGESVLITDPGGYDLPEPDGACLAICLSARDELIDGPHFFKDVRRLVAWLRRVERLVVRNRSATAAP